MEYEIIFYHSGKTAETERLIEKKFRRIGLSRRGSCASVKPSELGNALKRALSRSDAAVLVGGLDGGRQSTDVILSSMLSSKAGSLHSERLVDEEDNEAYLIRAGRQFIILFPDETEVIEEMLDKRMLSEIKRFFELSEDEEESRPIEDVTGELRKQLSGMSPAGSSYALMYAQKQSRELKRLRILFWSLLAGGVILLIIAIILFII